MAGHYELKVTTPTDVEAAALGEAALGARLAACFQISGPISSTYRWRGEVEQSTEWLLTLKTAADCLNAAMDLVRSLHSYELPEIIALPIEAGSPDYLDWITAETRPG